VALGTPIAGILPGSPASRIGSLGTVPPLTAGALETLYVSWLLDLVGARRPLLMRDARLLEASRLLDPIPGLAEAVAVVELRGGPWPLTGLGLLETLVTSERVGTIATVGWVGTFGSETVRAGAFRALRTATRAAIPVPSGPVVT
jgi:hypothetical protein